MHRVSLTFAAALLAFLLLASPAWAQWTWPLRGEVITRYSNGDDPYASGRHRGIDIAGETGQPVAAAAAGTVRFAGTVGSSGLTVSVRTVDGFDTSYLHLSSVSVREGQSVAAGERLGAVGTSGTRSVERPHLHFGVREVGSRHAYRDPLTLLPAAAMPPQVPVPGPAPAPAPVAPAPGSVPAPFAIAPGERSPAAQRTPIRRRAPEARRAPAARGAPGRQRRAPARSAPAARVVPAPAPDGTRAPKPAANKSRPARARRPASNAGHARRPVSRSGPAPRLSRPPASDSAEDAPAARAPGPGRAPGPAGGVDLGLVLACLGLLGAAALLGLSEDGRAATRRTGQRAAGLLRPLLGRR
jgi:hypothetical protein